MQIKLYVNGEKKTFSVPFVKARMFRRALEINDEMQERGGDSKSFSLEDIDAMVDFVVDLFDNQFTADELWDGLSTEEFVPEIMRCMNETMGRKQTDPNAGKRGR